MFQIEVGDGANTAINQLKEENVRVTARALYG